MEVYKLHPSVKATKLVVFNLPPKTPKYKKTQPFIFGFLLSYAIFSSPEPKASSELLS